jgi:hypothetical protein
VPELKLPEKEPTAPPEPAESCLKLLKAPTLVAVAPVPPLKLNKVPLELPTILVLPPFLSVVLLC